MYWSHPSFGPLQPGAAAHERVEPPAKDCDMAQRMSRGWSFISVVPVHNQWEPLFHLQGQRYSWVSLGPIGVPLGPSWSLSFYRGPPPWMRIAMNKSRRKNHSTLGKTMSKPKHMQHIYHILYQHHWDWMKLGFVEGIEGLRKLP